MHVCWGNKWGLSSVFPLVQVGGAALVALLLWCLHPAVPLADVAARWWFNPLVYIVLWSPALVVLSDFWRQGRRDWTVLLPVFVLAMMLMGMFYDRRTGYNQTLFFSAAALIAAVAARRFRRPPLYAWFFWLYFVVLAVSLVWSPEKQVGMKLLEQSLMFVCVPVAYCCFPLSESDKYLVMRAMVYSALGFVLLTLLMMLYQSLTLSIPLQDWLVFDKHFIHGTDSYELVYAWQSYRHPSYNALVLIAALVAAFCLCARRLLSKGGLVCLSLAVFFLLYITQSRIGVIMWGLVSLLGVLWMIKGRTWRIVYSLCCLLLFVAFALYLWLGTSHLGVEPFRFQIWETVVRGIKAHPLMGLGLGGMRHMPTLEALTEDKYWAGVWFHLGPHNQYLGDWMQSGVFALVALLLMMGSLLWTAVRQRNLALLLFWLCVAVFMLIEMPLNLMRGITLFTCFTCFFAARPSDKS